MWFPLTVMVLAAGCCLWATPNARGSDKLIGAKARDWQVTDWINSKPLTLGDLHGKVVLVRWWTGDGCPLCAATAPALNEFHEHYAGKGLVVIGFYHNKSNRPLEAGTVKHWVDKYSFRFPVAVDPDWQTLRRWWLNDAQRRWTSVSFLIDRQGVIRHIHPGGQYVQGDKDYQALKEHIELLLKETSPER